MGGLRRHRQQIPTRKRKEKEMSESKEKDNENEKKKILQRNSVALKVNCLLGITDTHRNWCRYLALQEGIPIDRREPAVLLDVLCTVFQATEALGTIGSQ